MIPEEVVLTGMGVEGDSTRADLISGEMIVPGVSGSVRLVVVRGGDGRFRVSRLVSSDPADFLNPAFAPGAAAEPPGADA